MPGTRYSLEVQPIIPARLERIEELASDLLYSWERQVRNLFWRLDPVLWTRSGHNPKVFLRQVAQQKLESAVRDTIFMQDFTRVLSAYDLYRQEGPQAGIGDLL